MRVLRHVLGAATLLLALGGGLYLWQLLGGRHDEGQLRFTLLFPSAEGLAEGAAIRYRGVPVGEVRGIELDRGGEKARVLCQLDARHRGTVGNTTRFWVVRPRFRGIARGASGLETLIKDSYITYQTPAGPLEPLPDRAIIPGLDAPPDEALGFDSRPSSPEEPNTGELQLTVLFEESDGLAAGSVVRLRGLPVGIVTEVSLDSQGRAVIVRARIRREHRQCVANSSIFWVARPTVSAGWLSGLDVGEMETLLGGPHLAFMTPSSPQSPPARDGETFVGVPTRPEQKWSPPAQFEATVPGNGPLALLDGALVVVHYSCIEKDLFSPNDSFSATSPGVLFLSADNRPVVLVARSGTDGSWVIEDVSGEPEIASEVWRVTLADGAVYGAHPVWNDPGGGDVALLAITDLAARPPEAPPVGFDVLEGGAALEILGHNGKEARHGSATLQSNGSMAGLGRNAERSVVIVDGKAVGIVGRPPGQEKLLFASFSLLPVTHRPAP